MKSERPRFALLTLAPLAWLLVVTTTASWQKIFSDDVRIGFLAQASSLSAKLASGAIPAEKIDQTRHVIFNNQLDALVTAAFLVLVSIVVLDAARVWRKALARHRGRASAHGAAA